MLPKMTDITIRLTDLVYEILKKYKEESGVAITNKIYDYIFRGLINEGLVSIKELKILEEKPNTNSKLVYS